MNIEIKKQKKKKKYYLIHSFREGKKVKKIARYLGSDLTEAELENLRKRAEVLIRDQIEFYKKTKDPLKHELSDKELKFLESIEPNEIISIDHLSEDDWKRFTEIFTYNTNA
ncbi:MAG: Fic family protein, partial [Nanoarchaeota archaeon]